ncbi:hypothetical protein [Psychromonas sp. psych-6C06]|uniref:hypothetical protein n=1 Tax=Psychromonas sp. psych-6C06 TaxID=2058089 RepID=UPI00187C28B6|nr:hypothetical protein [Psychromonas sp. psych-6C06]
MAFREIVNKNVHCGHHSYLIMPVTWQFFLHEWWCKFGERETAHAMRCELSLRAPFIAI